MSKKDHSTSTIAKANQLFHLHSSLSILNIYIYIYIYLIKQPHFLRDSNHNITIKANFYRSHSYIVVAHIVVLVVVVTLVRCAAKYKIFILFHSDSCYRYFLLRSDSLR